MDLTFIATCDLVGIARGRSIRSDEAEAKASTGVGWVPADLALTTFGDIADPNPFGSLGDLRLIPEPDARAILPPVGDRPPTRVQLASIVTLDGERWSCCPRTALGDAVRELEQRFGLRLLASFEQEFTLLGLASPGAPFSLEAHRRVEPFGSRLVEALAESGLEPETWLPEYGPAQFEITLAPAEPVIAADRAILVREIVRDLATAAGHRATFAPLVDPEGVGNGVHVHLSLWRGDEPVTLDIAGQLTADAGAFAAGIVEHAEAVVGWTAPSVVSPLRLTPHRWSAAATFVGRQNREALIRIVPGQPLGGGDPRRGANLEYRACDATANPWLALAALIHAGMDGIGRSLAADVVEGELDTLDRGERERRRIRALPDSVEAAMRACEGDGVADWFDRDLLATHVAIRQTEAKALESVDPRARCERYAAVI